MPKMKHHTILRGPRQKATHNGDRPCTTTTERLWDPVTERLAYAPGDAVPVDELDRLVTDPQRREIRITLP